MQPFLGYKNILRVKSLKSCKTELNDKVFQPCSLISQAIDVFFLSSSNFHLSLLKVEPIQCNFSLTLSLVLLVITPTPVIANLEIFFLAVKKKKKKKFALNSTIILPFFVHLLQPCLHTRSFITYRQTIGR